MNFATKLSYEDFKNYVVEELEMSFPDSEIKINKIIKNNGIILDGLIIMKADSKISPTIYLNGRYEDYVNKKLLIEDVVEEIICTYMNASAQMPETILYNNGFDLSYDKIKPFISCRLINYEANTELLKTAPYIKILDMAVVFNIFATEMEGSIGTIKITNEYLQSWNISIDELYDVAMQNTQRLFPEKMQEMYNVIKDIIGITNDEIEEAQEGKPMYVLSNEKGINGAVCILYDGVLKDISNKLKADLIILPSSIHEVIILPAIQGIDIKGFSDIVKDINQTQVPPDEVLSNSVYYYDSKKDDILIAI